MKLRLTTVLVAGVVCGVGAVAQDAAPAAPSRQTAAPLTAGQMERMAAGDSPSDPGPLATDVSSALTKPAVRAAMKKVVDWELRTREPHFNAGWTFAALYDGLLAYSKETGDPAGHDAVLRFAQAQQWKLIDTRFPHADDEALGQAYLDLYAEKPTPEKMAHVKEVMDRLVARKDEEKPVWWWCDALFMAPPVLVRMAAITGDHKYIDYMNHEWQVTAKLLYDKDEHLYFRDDRFLDLQKQHEANGKKIFWSRGDGWVMAGLVNILEYLPKNDPSRAGYVQQFKDMAAKVASVQGADGLWRTGLLDAETYKMPEISGSAFFTFAFAYGVRTGLLDAKVFRPVIEKSWTAMVQRIYADGRLGWIQPIGAAPDKFEPGSSYVYGVGAFLLAGSEIDKMVGEGKWVARPIRNPQK